MKTRLGAVILLVGLTCGCGVAPTEVREAPPVTAAPPLATPIPPLAPTPTPRCRNFKLCEGLIP